MNEANIALEQTERKYRMLPQAPTGYLIRLGKRYNLQGIHPHALRHTMAKAISLVAAK